MRHLRNHEVSVRTSSVIQKMMQKEPDERYLDPHQLLNDLIQIYHDKDPEHVELLQ